MSELIYLCGRECAAETYADVDFKRIVEQILPDNAPYRTEIVRDKNIVYCVINPAQFLPVRNESVCMGQMIPPREDWHQPGTPVPDGSYGIVRANEDTVELLSDMTASRTLYYYLMEDLFVASTSQRAVMHFKNSFVPDETAIAWMVSSGSLGPTQSWDKRVKALPPDARLRLDRSSWEATVTTGKAWEPFASVNRSKSSHREQLTNSLDNTFADLELDLSRWTLPLSGGLDSRELLLRLQDESSLTTITWGTKKATEESDNDAVRAQELAESCGVPHEYHTLPQEVDDIETVFDRFLTAGEGRIDHFQGYTDGFELFENFTKNGTDGIIRGDEGFGMTNPASKDPKNQTEVRHVIAAEMIDDFQSLPSLSIPGAETQRLHDRYRRHSDESLEMWRDRLYQTYRIPTVLASLTALKTPYVEVVNPYLTREILEMVRTLPDEMRTGKQLYTEYVMDKSPPVPVATQSPDPDVRKILSTPESCAYLRTELDTNYARSVLGDAVVDYTLKAISSDTGSEKDSQSDQLVLNTIKRAVGKSLPSWVVQRILSHTPVNRIGRPVSDVRLAFRLYVIQSMFERLERDVSAITR